MRRQTFSLDEVLDKLRAASMMGGDRRTLVHLGVSLGASNRQMAEALGVRERDVEEAIRRAQNGG